MTAYRPDSVQAARDWVADRIERRRPVKVHGVERSPSDHEQLVISGLDRLRFFDPEDMVIGVDAGFPVARLHQLVSERRMFLPLGSWFRGGTVGGLVAAGQFGPDRMTGGGIRDSIIGLELIDGCGSVVKAGGKVVKNVTGYDLSRLMIGSRGGYGVVTAVHFKIMPAPIEPRVLVLTPAPPSRWRDVLKDLHLRRLPLDWVQAVYREGEWVLLIGISGNELRRRRLVGELQTAFEQVLQVFAEADLPEKWAFAATAQRNEGFLSRILPDVGPAFQQIHGVYPTSTFLDGIDLEVLATFTEAAVVHPIGGDLHVFSREGERLQREMIRCLGKQPGYLVPRGKASVPLPAEIGMMRHLRKSLDAGSVFISSIL